MINFSDPFFLILFLDGFIFILAGTFMSIKPPKKINDFYGYRTKASKQNQQVWDFAQKYSARTMRLFGLGMIILSFGGWFLPLGVAVGAVLSILLLLIFSYLLIYDTEKAIKNKFKT